MPRVMPESSKRVPILVFLVALFTSFVACGPIPDGPSSNTSLPSSSRTQQLAGTLRPTLGLSRTLLPPSATLEEGMVPSGTQVEVFGTEETIEDIDGLEFLSRWGNHDIRHVAFTPDGNYLVATYRTKIYFFDSESLSLVKMIDTNAVAYDLAFTADNRFVAVRTSRSVLIFDIQSEELVATIHQEAASLAISPDGQVLAIASAGFPYDIEMWDIEQGDLIRELDNMGDVVTTMGFSPRGSILATGSNFIAIWDIEGTNLYFDGPFYSGGVTYSLSFSPDGKLLAQGDVGEVLRIWSVLDNGRLTIHRQISVDSTGTDCVAFSPDGKTLAGTSAGVYLWDMATAVRTRVLISEPRSNCNNLSWSPDGDSLAGSFWQGVRIWNVKDGTIRNNYYE